VIFVLTAEIKTMTMNKDDIDYDGMGNQGRVPVHDEDKKDWYLMFCCALIGVMTIILLLNVVSCNNTKCIGTLHKTKYHHKNTCNAFR